MLQPYALTSAAEYKQTAAKIGTAKDDAIERAINTASRMIEAELGRRLRYRAPEEEEGAANIVADVAIAAQPQTLTIAEQPTGGRTMVVSLTDTNRSLSAGAGKVTFTGTVGGATGQTEVLYFADGPRQHGRKFFTVLSSVVVSGVTTPTTAGDTIRVGSSLGMIEYHTPREPYEIRLMDRPYAVYEINEDVDQEYAAATELAVDVDYRLSADGRVSRIADALPYSFSGGYRSLKVRYSGWLGGLATVPDDLREMCIRLAAPLVQEWSRAEIGISSQSDALGNFTRLSAAGRMTDEIKAALAPYRRGDLFCWTGERDFDEEAT